MAVTALTPTLSPQSGAREFVWLWPALGYPVTLCEEGRLCEMKNFSIGW